MKIRLEVVGDKVELLPARLVVNEGQSHAYTSKTTSATDSMKIRLWIRMLAVRPGWDILLTLVVFRDNGKLVDVRN